MPNTYETKLWGGRFRGDEDALMQHFNSECWRTSWLVEPDIQGSLAHVAMQVARSRAFCSPTSSGPPASARG